MKRGRSDVLTWCALVAGLAAVYFAAAKLGLKLAFLHSSATAVWPPSGIALAAFLLLGYRRVWPGIWLGAFFVNLVVLQEKFGADPTSLRALATAAGIAVGNTLEGVTGAYLVIRFAKGLQVFSRLQDILKYALLAAVVSTTVSATFGVTSLYLGRYPEQHLFRFGATWFTWWVGDAVGDLVVTPLLLLWYLNGRVRWSRAQLVEIALVLGVLIVVGLAVFGGAFQNYPVGYLCFPALLWTAYRLGTRETATAIVLFSGIAIWGTLSGQGPYALGDPNQSLLLLQSFLGVNTVATLALSAVASEHRRIEEALRLEKELREREENFRVLAETVGDGIVSADGHGHLLFFNRAVERMFGYAASELIGQPLTLLMPEPFHEAHRRGLERYLATGEARLIGARSELAGRRKDGSEFPLELALGSWKVREAHYFTGILRDISARKSAEEALRRTHEELDAAHKELHSAHDALRLANVELDLRVQERTEALAKANAALESEVVDRKRAEEQFRLTVESAPNAMVMVDAKGRIVLLNAQTEKVFGYRREELQGQAVEILIPERFRSQHPADRAGFFADPHARPMGIGRDLYGLHKNGTEFPVEIGLNPIQTEGGVRVLSSIIDITERKRAERDLARRAVELARSNAELEQFAYVSSHDLQEPLRMVASFVQLLERKYKGKLDPDADGYIHYIVDGAKRMQGMIKDLLSLARVGSPVVDDSRLVDCQEVLDTVLLNLQRAIEESGARITSDDLPTVRGDATQITLLLQNLVGNSLKFRGPEAPCVKISARPEDGQWLFSIHDNGIGIEPQFQARIFQIFQRVHDRDNYPGSGIGLAIAKKIVERHGGRIWVESEKDKGAIFRFTLPKG